MIAASAADEGVVPEPSVKPVVPLPTVDAVIPVGPVEKIVLRCSVKRRLCHPVSAPIFGCHHDCYGIDTNC